VIAALSPFPPGEAKPARVTGMLKIPMMVGASRLRRLLHHAADVDEVVGGDAEADPAIHSPLAGAAAAETVSPFDADAPTSAAPLLAVFLLAL
jgi:hypothetical protein